MLDKTLAPELLLMILKYLEHDFNYLKPFMLITKFLKNFLIENIIKHRLKLIYTLDSTDKSPNDFLTKYYSSILSLSSRIIFNYDLPIIERIVNDISFCIKHKVNNKLNISSGIFYLSNIKINGKVAYFGSLLRDGRLPHTGESKMIMFYDIFKKMYVIVLSDILTVSLEQKADYANYTNYMDIYYKYCIKDAIGLKSIRIWTIPINHSNYMDTYSSIFEFEFDKELHSTVEGVNYNIKFSSHKSVRKYSPFRPINRYQHIILKLPDTSIRYDIITISHSNILSQKSITFIPHYIYKIPKCIITNLELYPFNNSLNHLDLSGISNELENIYKYLVDYCKETLKTLVSFGFPRFMACERRIIAYVHSLLLKMPNIVAVKVPKFINSRSQVHPFYPFKKLIEGLPSSVKYLSYYLNSIDTNLEKQIKNELKKCNPEHNLEQIARDKNVIFTMNNSIKFLDVNGYELDFSKNEFVELQDRLKSKEVIDTGIMYSLAIGYYKTDPMGHIIRLSM
jgi:hypothetical protein